MRVGQDVEDGGGEHRGCRFAGCGDHAEGFLRHAVDCLFVLGGVGVEDLVEDGAGVGGLGDGACAAEFVFGGGVAGEDFGDLDADELGCEGG